MNSIYVDELPKKCKDCPFGYVGYAYDFEEVRFCKLHKDHCMHWIALYNDKFNDCPLKLLKKALAEERKKVVGELKVDIRSLFNSYASSLIDYCIWNKNADENYKLYNNFKRIINDRLDKVLDLFDKRIDQIERGE